MEAVKAFRGRRRLLAPVPFALWRALARLASMLPHAPLTPDQVALTQADNLVSPTAATFDDLGLEPAGLEGKLLECLPAA